ncbi:hypothetical protein DQ04_10491010 [Trypanosoma grayi]|uniref:hypothetical protein n=1 Tax=Trypanosoma grayi TaxID=71804 RepID=UPI0004F3FE05|nr:hypothetical protein DQ04_10491010 [Trypanosoma grayi]KEG07231.1 hypothetical protein DQ04_10491010 [Trypanosoma grayi]
MRTSPPNTRHHAYRGGQGQFQQPQRRGANLSPPSGNRSPNSGGPSSYHDRLFTIRLVCPCTNSVVCTRLSRVLPTAARGQNGAAVCEDFMHTQSCRLGELCPKVHVAQEHTWNYITHDINRNTGLYEPGFILQCYDPCMTHYYSIPSEFIFPTRGSNEYVKMHNEHGDNFKAKFKLCDAMTNKGKCELGATCEDIHTAFQDLSEVEGNATHIAEPAMLMRYPRLRTDVIVRVFEQNSNEAWVDYPGDQVLVTLGSRQYMAAFDAEGTIPKKKMQHCAHFRTKNLCRMGENCRFLHVVTDINGLLGNSVTSGVSPYSTSRGDSPTSDINVNVRSRHGVQWPSGSQVAAWVAQKYSEGGAADVTPLNLVQGGTGDPTFSSSTTIDNNTNSSAGFLGRKEMYAVNDGVSSVGQARMGFNSNNPNTLQSPPDASAKTRMISPTRRNNPYAMHPVDEEAVPQQQQQQQQQQRGE